MSTGSAHAGARTGRALFIDGPRRASVRDVPFGAPGPGELHARALASGISQGSELLVYRGEAAAPGTSVDPSVPGGSAGGGDGTGYPLRYGYAWVGEVEAAGPPLPGVAPVAVGSRVFAFAPHGTDWVAPAGDFRVLPSGVPAERGVLAANLETAVNAVWDAGIGLGDEVAVLGQGVVGLLISLLALRSGGRVTAVEGAPRRAELAAKLGARVLAPTAPELGALAARCDVVLEVTGDPGTLDQAIALAAFEARLVVVSNYGTRRAPVDLGPGFHRRRLQLISSQVSAVATSRRPRWDHARRFALVGALLGELPLDMLLDRRVTLEQTPATLAELDRHPGEALQVVVAYPPASA